MSILDLGGFIDTLTHSLKHMKMLKNSIIYIDSLTYNHLYVLKNQDTVAYIYALI